MSSVAAKRLVRALGTIEGSSCHSRTGATVEFMMGRSPRDRMLRSAALEINREYCLTK
jgi:hypothetical protein